jgi:hypothetical protein
MKYIIYDGPGEILITNKKDEAGLLEEGFDLSEYDRKEIDSTFVTITSTFKAK